MAAKSDASKNLTADLREELAESVRVRDGDREYRVTKQRAVLKALIAAAAQGNVSAATALFSLQARLVKAAADDPSEPSISDTDKVILDDFINREIARRELSTESKRKSIRKKGESDYEDK